MKEKYKFCPLCGHRLTFGNIEGRGRLFCRQCRWVSYKNPLPVTACAAKNRAGQILLTKRNIEPAINKWALPGGFIESEENPEKACLRELIEETGATGKIKRLIGVYLHKTKKYGPLLVIGYEVELFKDVISVGSEVKEAKFVSRKTLPYIPFVSHRKIIEEVFKNRG